MVQIVQNTTYNNAYDDAAYFDKSNEKKKTFFIYLTLSVPISGEENKNKLNFYFNTTFRNVRDVKGGNNLLSMKGRLPIGRKLFSSGVEGRYLFSIEILTIVSEM